MRRGSQSKNTHISFFSNKLEKINTNRNQNNNKQPISKSKGNAMICVCEGG